MEKSVVLIVLDGFGLLPDLEGNAIIQAKTPVFDSLVSQYRSIAIHAAGEAVGLPWGEMGNSEVGHLNIGAGRVVLQDYPQITKAIQAGSFFTNPAFAKAVAHLKRFNGRLHLVGLLSDGAVHSHVEHLYGLLELAKRNGIKQVLVHGILDGRDSPPKNAAQLVEPLLRQMATTGVGTLASLVGRYFAMDRDRRYDRTKVAYDLMVRGAGAKMDDPIEAIKAMYYLGYSDEFMPARIRSQDMVIREGDAVILFNFRADRAIALTKAFVDPSFDGFRRQMLKNILFVTLTNYEHGLPVEVAFTPVMLNDPETNPLNDSLAEVISSNGLTQLHLAETEKYAHVTYFFNAGRDKPLTGEHRILVPSPKVATYETVPAMSLNGIVREFAQGFAKVRPRFSLINLANPDMVGHTGNLAAAVRAIEAVDQSLGKLLAAGAGDDVTFALTGDHGNAEQMVNPVTKGIDKEHTVNPVPFIMVDSPPKQLKTTITAQAKLAFHSSKPVGIFADIAPTVLDLLGLPVSPLMTGTSLRRAL